jgi:hypothetical protein
MSDLNDIKAISEAYIGMLDERVSKKKIDTARQQAAKEVDDMVDYLVASYLKNNRDVADDFFPDEDPRAGQAAAKKLSRQFLEQLRSYINDVAKNPNKYSRR